MTEKSKHLFIRFSKKEIVKEDEKYILIDINKPNGFLEQVLTAFNNPNKAVFRDDEE